MTYHGVTDLGQNEFERQARFANVRATRYPNDPNDPNDRLVLFVGSIFNRRHVPELIEGFSRLTARHRATRLEIVGANRTRPYQDLEAVAARWPCGRTSTSAAYVSDDRSWARSIAAPGRSCSCPTTRASA